MDGAVISVARQLVAHGGGAWAAVGTLDTATGAARERVAWLGPDGRERAAPAGGARRAAGSFASVALAAAAVPALGPWGEAAAAALGGAPVQEAATDGRTLWALTGDREAPDGQAQALLRLALPPRDGEGAERIDLGPLGLGPGRAVTAMSLDAGWVGLFVGSPVAGFELWRASSWSPGPRFELQVGAGAHRFAVDAVAAAVLPYGGRLLVGTAALADGPGRVGNWGPELLLMRPDGDWDLVWGQPRFTPQGLKEPLSGRLPGLGRMGNAAVKALAVLPGGGVAAVVQDWAGEAVARREEAGFDLLDYAGEARLLRGSADLRDWDEVRVPWAAAPGAVAALAAVEGGLLVGHEGATDAAPVTRVALR